MEKRTLLLLKEEQALNSRSAELKASKPVRLHNYHASKDLNAFIAFDEELFSSDKINTSEPGLPLSGLPFSCKDNINVKNFATTAGTPGLIDFYPMDDAPVISRLKALGAVMCGKTNMHELSFGVTSLSGQWGSVGNPAHPGHIAGGSSGGSAAAVAAGISAFSVGTDTGGSVRIPAALCGVAGFRPSTGRYPTRGIVPVSRTKDTPGFIAPTVSDLALLDAAMMGEPAITPRLPSRIGLPAEFMWSDLDITVRETCMKVVRQVARAGVEIVTFDDSLFGKLNKEIQFAVPFFEFFIDFPAFLLEQRLVTDFDTIISQISDPAVASILQRQNAQEQVSWKDYMHGLQSIGQLRAYWDQIYSKLKLDAILYPTLCCEVPRIGNAAQPDIFNKLIRNTDIASSVGAPSVTMPVAERANLSVGLSLDGLPKEDRQLISHALAIEAILQR